MALPKQRRARRRRQTGPTWLTGALVDAGTIIGTTLITTLFLLFISSQIHDTTSENLNWSPVRPTTAITLPTPRANPTAQSTRPAATPTPAPAGGAAEEAPDDAAIQAEISKRITTNPNFATQAITATVSKGKVILVGKVPTNELKDSIEKLVLGVKGVKEVSNQIVVASATPNP
jgi:hypothetical protein